MGDFNADCGYVNGDDWSQIRLRTDDRFDWVIPDTDDTTVSGNTHCAYDRYIFLLFFMNLKEICLFCSSKNYGITLNSTQAGKLKWESYKDVISS